MPFQQIPYAQISPQTYPERNLVKEMLDNLKQRYEVEQMPQQREAQELANAFNRMRNQQEPQRFQGEQETHAFQNALRQAQFQKAQREAEMPLGGSVVPGAIGQALWLHKIKEEYGENSPQYADAKRAFDAELEQKKVLNQYRTNLADNADKRFSTNLGKQEQEIADIRAGYAPGTGRKQPISPDEQKAMLGRYELKRQKDISDTQTRQRALFASNVDKTLAEINPEDLTQYGGLKGQTKLKADQLASSLGSPPKQYQEYQKALTLSNLLAKQVRQFYGDSITPQIQEKLATLTNPASWINDPNVALSNFKTFKDILQKETQTYRVALKNTEEFGNEQDGEDSDPLGLFK